MSNGDNGDKSSLKNSALNRRNILQSAADDKLRAVPTRSFAETSG
jgi:hypothetical protein